jgi:hypothetical protein
MADPVIEVTWAEALSVRFARPSGGSRLRSNELRRAQGRAVCSALHDRRGAVPERALVGSHADLRAFVLVAAIAVPSS